MVMDILTHTPAWVFGLLIFLIVLGFQQSKDRTVKKLMILPLPIGMSFLSFFGTYTSFGLTLMPIGLWLITLISISYLFVKYFPVRGVIFNKQSQHFFIAGSWLPFTLMMAIFFTKYFVGVVSALYSNALTSPVFIISLSLLYGTFSGVFTARLVSSWRTIKLKG